MSDVFLFQTNDDGDINVSGGIVELSGGLDTAVYLSMFGGRDWWGNLGETEPAKQYTAETGRIINGTPATSGNLLRVKNAVERDLAWMITSGAALGVVVTVSIPARNRVLIVIDIAGGPTLEFLENWEAQL